MTRGRDDDALSWDGDDDPTLDVGSGSPADADPVPEPVEGSKPTPFEEQSPADAAPVPESDSVPEPVEGSKPEPPEELGEEPERRQMSSAALVGLGILGGVYLLLTLGWLLGAARLQLVASLFLEPAAFQITLWLAVAALPLWFVTVLWLTRTGRSWLRFVLLVAGAVLLIPWPFVLAGALL
ncbi:DNA polymerase III subunit gamma/tau [Microbacterium sp. B2969]|uniref:DNA polymerase III subunit gamma/tau n=1 Tax=Microbacterium alkaliflavum TaxID=3248839 RepID=A0ABW7Q7Q5_9MICO